MARPFYGSSSRLGLLRREDSEFLSLVPPKPGFLGTFKYEFQNQKCLLAFFEETLQVYELVLEYESLSLVKEVPSASLFSVKVQELSQFDEMLGQNEVPNLQHSISFSVILEKLEDSKIESLHEIKVDSREDADKVAEVVDSFISFVKINSSSN